MSSVSAETFFADLMKRCWSNAWTEGRALGSFVRHNETKSLNVTENGPSNAGGLALGIKKRTRMGWYSARGGSPLAISIAVMPRLHMSAFALYPACRITSGAIQNGVP